MMKLNKEQKALVDDNMNLVPFTVKNMNLPTDILEDALQYGYIVLMESAQSFKPELGYKFCTYAVNCIKGKVSSYVNFDSDKRYNAPIISKRKTILELSQRDDLNPDDICNIANINITQYNYIITNKYNFSSLNEVVIGCDNEKMKLMDTLIDYSYLKSYDLVECNCVVDSFHNYIMSMKHTTQQYFIDEYFKRVRNQISGMPYELHKTIADRYGVSRQRVNQIFDNLDNKFRKYLKYVG